MRRTNTESKMELNIAKDAFPIAVANESKVYITAYISELKEQHMRRYCVPYLNTFKLTAPNRDMT